MIPKRVYTPAKKKTILIVDDDPVIFQRYQEHFQHKGFRVEAASNDCIALRVLKSNPIDLIILDLCIPGMDIVELLKNIRSQFDSQALPIIVVSNAYLGNLGRAALEAGANKCLLKIDSAPKQMLEVVRELFGIPPSHIPSATSEIVASNGSRTLAARFDSEPKEKRIGMLLGNAPETLETLRAAHQVFARAEQEDLGRNEVSKMHRQVRWLAGPAGPLGFWKITKMAAALEALLIQLHNKPRQITPSVNRTVAQAIDTLGSLVDQARTPQAEGSAPPRILVVDDEAISREAVCSALRHAGLSATNLDDSLAAERLLEQEHFDLIFLDVDMPGKSGLQLCVNIREMATNRATPVVFVTSRSDFGSRAQSTLSGGSDFIAKPFLPVELAVKALSWLFKEAPEQISMATEQGDSPAETGAAESQLCRDHAALGNLDEGALQMAGRPSATARL